LSRGDDPLRIIHVFRAPLGGLFRHVMDLARGQIAAGHQVGILCDSTSGGQREADALTALAPQLALGLKRIPMQRKPGAADASAVRALMALRKATKPHIIHGHGSKGGAFARLPALASPSWPVTCYTPHGGSFNYFPGSSAYRTYMAVERFLKPRTGAFMMESQYIADRVRAAIGPLTQPLHVVHNGISPDEFAPVTKAPDAGDFLYVGELRYVKGIDTLLQAMSELLKSGRPATLRIQGSGPDEADLRAHVASLGLGDHVTFAPPGPIRAAFATARTMVVPSRAESLPYVVLEAAAAGQPLVSTHVGGIPEIFGPHADQLIAPDSVEELTAALRAKLDTSPEDLAREAAALSAYVGEHFSLANMIAGILAGYEEALSRRKNRRAWRLSLP
jgi:glycosyltransferase involved in cell wall biosynthesis